MEVSRPDLPAQIQATECGQGPGQSGADPAASVSLGDLGKEGPPQGEEHITKEKF